MKTVKIQLNEKEVEISSIPLRKLLEVFKLIKLLPKKIEDLKIDGDNQTAMVAELISESGDEIFEILELLSSIPKAELEELDLAGTVRLFRALLEVNDVEMIKKESGEIAKMFKANTKK
jgi:hypothetical protein